MAGTNLYWGHGEDALRELAEARRDPGVPQRPRRAAACPPTTRASSRARAATALEGRRRRARHRRADGLPARLRRGVRRGDRDRRDRPRRARARAPARGGGRVLRRHRRDARRAGRRRRRRHGRVARAPARRSRREKREAEREQLDRRRARRCTRCASTASSRRCSTATRSSSATAATSSPTPAASSTPTSRAAGSIPGPFGCLGSGPGYALAAKLAHPDRQVVLLLGDGAFGFSGMEFDTLARHGVNVVGVMGNNGIWALEKHPMEFLYGYSVAAELRPETRYDQVVEALGGHGELVRAPGRAAAGARARVRGRRAGAGERADRPVGGLPAVREPAPERALRAAVRMRWAVVRLLLAPRPAMLQRVGQGGRASPARRP